MRHRAAGSPARGAAPTRKARSWRRPEPPDADDAPADRDPACALCDRPIPPGARSSLHHLVPRARGGARLGTVRLHQVCHSAIHARYSEAEIARRLADVESLRADPELARFAAWVRTKPPDFHAPTRRARQER